MTETEEAIALANRVLDRVNADPDDDMAILARQFLRAHEADERGRRVRNWLRGQANAEREPKAKAAFIEAHNAALAIIEGRA